MTDYSPPDLVAMPVATLRPLLQQLGDPMSAQAVHTLRQAGYAGGTELAAAFDAWMRENGEGDAAELGLEEFNARVAAFFEQGGWGQLTMSSIHDLVAAVDIAECWEPRAGRAISGPCCHVSTGAIAAFFSTFAPYTLGSMEVECAASGHAQCRFLLGPPEVLDELYGHLAGGHHYTDALAQLSEVSASA
ncbi:MAG TPA: V4R domain-containing protein [Gemmatimonadaceae bacterium]|nr:V4R domain-containing protein [Gemmatimonadaceae bacterium]